MSEEKLGPEAYRAAYEYSADGILFTAPDGRIVAANPAACAILRRPEEAICDAGARGLLDPADHRSEALLEELRRTGSARGAARMVRGDGTPVEVELSARPVPGAGAGARARSLTIVRDVTTRVAMEHEFEELNDRLRELALTDELTGLRNRRGFLAVGAHMLEVADRHVTATQLLYLDVDNLKELNDEFGHPAGDAGLQAVARALARVLRHADVVARIGGDEFVALVLGLGEDGRQVVEQRLEEHLRADPAAADAGRVVEVSVGWASRPAFAPFGVEDMLAEADAAMYRVKEAKAAAKAGGRTAAPRPRLATGS